MGKARKSTIEVQGTSITVMSQKQEDSISLKNIARFKNADRPDDFLRDWLRNKSDIIFPGPMEHLSNPGFHSVEFDGINMQAGLNSFTLDPRKWIEESCKIGIVSQAGRYSGSCFNRVTYPTTSKIFKLLVQRNMDITHCNCIQIKVPKEH